MFHGRIQAIMQIEPKRENVPTANACPNINKFDLFILNKVGSAH